MNRPEVIGLALSVMASSFVNSSPSVDPVPTTNSTGNSALSSVAVCSDPFGNQPGSNTYFAGITPYPTILYFGFLTNGGTDEYTLEFSGGNLYTENLLGDTPIEKAIKQFTLLKGSCSGELETGEFIEMTWQDAEKSNDEGIYGRSYLKPGYHHCYVGGFFANNLDNKLTLLCAFPELDLHLYNPPVSLNTRQEALRLIKEKMNQPELHKQACQAARPFYQSIDECIKGLEKSMVLVNRLITSE